MGVTGFKSKFYPSDRRCCSIKRAERIQRTKGRQSSGLGIQRIASVHNKVRARAPISTGRGHHFFPSHSGTPSTLTYSTDFSSVTAMKLLLVSFALFSVCSAMPVGESPVRED